MTAVCGIVGFAVYIEPVPGQQVDVALGHRGRCRAGAQPCRGRHAELPLKPGRHAPEHVRARDSAPAPLGQRLGMHAEPLRQLDVIEPAAHRGPRRAAAGRSQPAPHDVAVALQTATTRPERVLAGLPAPLGWTAARVRHPEQAVRWAWLLIAAYVQLRLARPSCRPAPSWERRPRSGRPLTPCRGRRAFRNLRDRLGTPARRRKSPVAATAARGKKRTRRRRRTARGRVNRKLSGILRRVRGKESPLGRRR